MSEDYRKGFQDGFKLGLEEGKRNQNINPVSSYWSKENCPKCNMKVSDGYVCSSPNCPGTFTQVTSSGAVGSMDDNMGVSYGPVDWAGNPTSVQSDK